MSGYAGANEHEKKSSQPATKDPAAIHQPKPKTPAPKPHVAVTEPADDALTSVERLAHVAETEAAALSDGRLDRVLAPDAVIAESATRIVAAFRGVQEALDRESLPPTTLAPAMKRLDDAIGTLYVLGRRHHVRMREAHLEQVFDLLDGALAKNYETGQAHRANTYYDDEAPKTPTGDVTPDAANLNREVKSTAGSEPTSRAAVLAKAKTIGDEMCSALGAALGSAELTIKEADRPAEKSLLEKLADIAAKVLLQVAELGMGELLGAGFGRAASALGAEAHLGKEVTEIIVDGLKDGGCDAIKEALADTHGAETQDHHSETAEDTNGKLTPKSAYLEAARMRTEVAKTGIRRRFAARATLFDRLPTDTLSALVDAFDAKSVIAEYTTLIVREWVNFGKKAAEAGVEMRDPEKLKEQGAISKLDNVLDPYGVLRIGVRVDAAGKPHLERARIGGISDAVLEHLRKLSNQTLGEIALHRRVEIVAESSDLSGEGFELDPFGVLVAKPARLTDVARMKFARIPGHQLGESVSDGDVYAGMFALTSWLRTIPCAKIEAGGE
jgi:hypothetical protein